MRFFIYSLVSIIFSCHFYSKSSGFNKERMAPSFLPMEWMQSNPINIDQLKGKVILLRWWTDECQYCINTSSSLNHFYSVYKDSGLVVIGIYHPKPEPRIVEEDEMRLYIAEKQFKFPIAIDADWKNLNQYWLYDGTKAFTSVSFLIDKTGKIRYTHPGGEYHLEFIPGHESCVADFHSMDSCIQRLLHE